MKQQMCSRCGERPAVVFIQKMENDKVTPEGLCIKCARELNIGSINQMIDKLGISDEEIEAASEQMADFMENMGDFNLIICPKCLILKILTALKLCLFPT